MSISARTNAFPRKLVNVADDAALVALAATLDADDEGQLLAYQEDTDALYKWTGAGFELVGGEANDRLFADDTTVAPATAGEPTIAEITTFAGTNRDTIIYYTGTDTATDAPTYVYHIDNAGAVTLIQSPSSSGIDDVLSAGQQLTANRTIEQENFNLTIAGDLGGGVLTQSEVVFRNGRITADQYGYAESIASINTMNGVITLPVNGFRKVTVQAGASGLHTIDRAGESLVNQNGAISLEQQVSFVWINNKSGTEQVFSFVDILDSDGNTPANISIPDGATRILDFRYGGNDTDTNQHWLLVNDSGVSEVEDLPIRRYSADGAISDEDQHAIFETGAVNITLPAAVENRRILVSKHEAGDVTITADGTEEYTNASGTSTDQTLTVNRSYEIGTLLGRAGTGWDVYEGAVGVTSTVSNTLIEVNMPYDSATDAGYTGSQNTFEYPTQTFSVATPTDYRVRVQPFQTTTNLENGSKIGGVFTLEDSGGGVLRTLDFPAQNHDATVVEYPYPSGEQEFVENLAAGVYTLRFVGARGTFAGNRTSTTGRIQVIIGDR